MVAVNQYLGGTGLNPVRTYMFFKASFFQSAELQLTCKENDFILFAIRGSKKFHCEEK